MRARFIRWSIINEKGQDAYAEMYGENGQQFVDIMETAPYEIAVISQLITYLQKKRQEAD